MKVYVFSLLIYFNNHVLNKIPSRRLRLFWYRRVMRFSIARGSFVHLGVTFDTWKNFSMGSGSVINAGCRVDNRALITIGASVSISQNVTLLTGDHDLFDVAFAGRTRPINIRDHVFIGTSAIVLPGITLSAASAVAAGSLVAKDVPAGQIVGGVPAKPISGLRPSGLNYDASYGPLFQ
ncbi:acyltransferase [Microbacterium hatanonis]|uniref:acyltransferase n=1 Tax=Microbacterium hatanonis TaxID=404366 RepID=UPI001C9BD65E|nr:acyltransferase [Microbacterium hatanonis]